MGSSGDILFCVPYPPTVFFLVSSPAVLWTNRSISFIGLFRMIAFACLHFLRLHFLLAVCENAVKDLEKGFLWSQKSLDIKKFADHKQTGCQPKQKFCPSQKNHFCFFETSPKYVSIRNMSFLFTQPKHLVIFFVSLLVFHEGVTVSMSQLPPVVCTKFS